MSIAVHGMDLFPKAQMEELLARFTALRASRVRALVGAGISVDRISIVTRAGCSQCHGSGVVPSIEHGPASVHVTLSECTECPGVCLDGKPLVRAARASGS